MGGNVEIFSLPITNPVAAFSLIALILLVVPLFARRMKVPSMVGLILAGVIIGPKGFSILDFDSGLKLLSMVGLLYIMFVAGLEIDLDQFLGEKLKAVTFGLLIFCIAMAGGITIGNFIPHPPKTSHAMFCLLMGALMSSQTLLTYPIVSRLGLSRNLAATISVGATLLTDIMALMVLAVVERIHSGETQAGYWMQLVFGFLALAAVSIYLLPRLGRWFYQNVNHDDTGEYLFLFTSLLLVASLSRLAGLEPLIGAFMAGLSLNSLVPEQSRLMNRVQFIGNAIFIPIFLIAVGMLVDFRAFTNGLQAWMSIAMMTVVAVAAKFLAARLTGFLYKFPDDQAWLMFGMVVNKAGVTIATAIVGFQIGLFSQDVLNGAIIIIFITCLIGPWITESYGRRYALKLSSSGQRAQHRMPQRILVPLSNPTKAEQLMNIAFMIRDRKLLQPVYPLTIAIDGPGVDDDLASMEKMLSQAVVFAAAADIPVHPETRVDTDVAACLTRAVKEIRASCMVIGWNIDRSLPRAIFGSILDRVLEQSTELVLVCKVEQPVNTFQRLILVVPPLSHRISGFHEAVFSSCNLASQAGLKIVLVSLKSDISEVESVIKANNPAVSPLSVPFEGWSKLWEVVGSNMRRNDLVLMMSCRQGSLFWQPMLDRQPQDFIRLFPDSSLIVAYPAESAPDSDFSNDAKHSRDSGMLHGIFQPSDVMFGLEKMSLQEGVKKILSRYLDKKSELEREKLGELFEGLMQARLEIAPGFMLFHVRCEELPDPVAMMGISESGFETGDNGDVANVLFVLLSPSHHAPEKHLRMLSDIARLVISIPTVDNIKKARSLEDLAKVFSP